MKSVYSSLVALVVFVVLAPLAIADPGTTWGNTISGPDRFQVLSGFGGGAVLDQETGRVWELSPSTSPMTSTAAFTHCYQLEVGGRKGWRLPTIEELASLVDTSQRAPALRRLLLRRSSSMEPSPQTLPPGPSATPRRRRCQLARPIPIRPTTATRASSSWS